MTKISEEYEKYKDAEGMIKYYKDIIAEWKEKSIDLERAMKKAKKLECIKDALGDIDMESDYLDIFLKSDDSFAQTPIDVVRVYDIIKDAPLSKKEVEALVDSYYLLKDKPELFPEIKKSIGEYKDLYDVLDYVYDDERMHGLTDCYRMEFLKEVFTEFCIPLYGAIRYRGLRAHHIMDVLPTKEFMEDTKIKAHEMTVAEPRSIAYKPAQDLVYFRVISGKFEKEEYPKAKPDEKIYLAHSEYGYGTTIYTSFTKGEYEEDLEKAVQLRKKKGPGYIGW